MKLKNILIVVRDIEKSKKFYRDLFGLTAEQIAEKTQLPLSYIEAIINDI